MPGRTAIGLDIGTSGVRAAELSYGKHGITLERFGQVALPPGAVQDGEVVDVPVVVEAVQALWKGSGFKRKDVALGVANQRVIVRQVDLPYLPPAEFKDALPLQVQSFLPFPVEDCVLDFHVTDEVDEGSGRQLRGLLVAAARSMVMSNVTAVEAAGLRVTSVDLTSFAVLRSVGRTHADVATEALVDVGTRVSNLVVHSGGVPRFVRILLMGGQDVTDAIAERLGIPSAYAEGVKRHAVDDIDQADLEAAWLAADAAVDEFADEIRGSLAYYAASHPGFPVERIVLSGGGSQLDGLSDRLVEMTRLDVVAGDVLSPLHLGRTGLDDEQLRHVQPLAAVPVGLALGVIA
ncbi:cell division protein FtsA [Kineococcus sp. NUM-3379]